MQDPRSVLKGILLEALRGIAPGASEALVHFERPRNPEHGDISCTVALTLARELKRNPREIAQRLLDATAERVQQTGLFERPTIAGAGFYNVRQTVRAKQAVIAQVLEQGASYGRGPAPQPHKTQVEFVSANPTGPLHVGHGRQAALGDAIAALLEWQGHAVTREFYYNDAGAQIEKLALSVQARARGLKPGDTGWPAEGYNGEYTEDIAREISNAGALD